MKAGWRFVRFGVLGTPDVINFPHRLLRIEAKVADGRKLQNRPTFSVRLKVAGLASSSTAPQGAEERSDG